MKKILLSVSLLLAGPALADPPPPRMRVKEDRLHKIAADKKRADKNPWDFTAPDGFTVTATDPNATGPDFSATSVTPAATMTVVVEKGPVTVDNALLAEQPKKLTDKFVAEHSGGSAKVVKKELVKLDDGSAARVVLETRADGKKTTKPMREVHYIIGNATHHAHLTYATAAASFGKLEKKFDESLRKTKPYTPEP